MPSPFLRDQLAAARINRIKTRVAQNWQRKQSEQFPICESCGKRHPPSAHGGLVGLLKALSSRSEEDDDQQPAATRPLN